MILFLSCYELGHAPHSIALALGLCKEQSIPTCAQDLSVEVLDKDLAAKASLVAVSVPMHTALRLGLALLPQLKEAAPRAKIAFFGLYAALNEQMLFQEGVDFVLSGEVEPALLALYRGETGGASTRVSHAAPLMEKISFVTPAREKLPPIESYARLIVGDERRLVGYTESSRGCLHHCTHCPIPPVYKGRFFVVPREIVLSDIEAQVARGAEHITFGDPDFLNGPRHAMMLVREIHQMFPRLTFDFTAKVEHLLKHQGLLPELVHCGAVFVVSAFESLSKEVLSRLNKGHTREDILQLLPLLDAARLPVRPTFVPFTPWTTLDDMIELFDVTAQRSLVENIDPIQYSIRLLLPPGSLLLQDATLQVGPLDERSLSYPWRHQDPLVDELAATLQQRVESASQEPIEETFMTLRTLVYKAANRALREEVVQKKKAPPPRLSESWFC